MSRKAASVSVKYEVSLPPEAIEAAFSGWAKVEAAKKGESKGVDLSWLVPLIPILLPALLKMCQSDDDEEECEPSCADGVCHRPCAKVKVPVPCEESACKQEQPKDQVKVDVCDNCPVQVVCGKVLCSGGKVSDKVSDKVEDCKNVEGSVEEEKASENKPADQSARVVYKEAGPNLFGTKLPGALKDGDLKNLLGPLGGNGEGMNEGLADMMKMFAPMMQGLMGGFAGMAPNDGVEEQVADKKKGEVNESAKKLDEGDKQSEDEHTKSDTLKVECDSKEDEKGNCKEEHEKKCEVEAGEEIHIEETSDDE